MLRASLLERVWLGFTNGYTRRHPYARGSAGAAPTRRLPRVGPLAGRMLLATITVNRTADQLFQDPHATVEVLKEPGIPVSLLDAINIANNSPGAATRRKPLRPGVESLEGRIAPAVSPLLGSHSSPPV